MRTIGIIGIDGAGKSSLSGRLVEELLKEGLSVSQSHHNQIVKESRAFCFLRRIMGRRRRPVVSSAAAVGERRGRSATESQARYYTSLLVNAVTLMLIRRRRTSTILVWDRPPVDMVLDAERYGGGQSVPRMLRRLSLRYLMTDVTVVLLCDANEAFARKGEHTLERLTEKNDAYGRVPRMTRAECIVLDTSRFVLEVTLRDTLSQCRRLLDGFFRQSLLKH